MGQRQKGGARRRQEGAELVICDVGAGTVSVADGMLLAHSTAARPNSVLLAFSVR